MVYVTKSIMQGEILRVGIYSEFSVFVWVDAGQSVALTHSSKLIG